MRQCAGQVEVAGAALADHDAVGGLVDFLVGANRRIVPDQLAVQARRAAEARAAAALQAEQWAEAKTLRLARRQPSVRPAPRRRLPRSRAGPQETFLWGSLYDSASSGLEGASDKLAEKAGAGWTYVRSEANSYFGKDNVDRTLAAAARGRDRVVGTVRDVYVVNVASIKIMAVPAVDRLVSAFTDDETGARLANQLRRDAQIALDRKAEGSETIKAMATTWAGMRQALLTLASIPSSVLSWAATPSRRT